MTHSDVATRPRDRWRGPLHVVLTLMLMLAVGMRIASVPVEPIFDQGFVQFQFAPGFPSEFTAYKGYPTFEQGLSAYLIPGLVNSVKPYDPITTNMVVRTIAAILFLFAGALLSWALSERGGRWSFILFMLLLVTSRFPFLWLSSELLSGAYLMIAFWSILKKHPFPVTAFFLALLSLAKPEGILPAGLIVLYLVLRDQPSWSGRVRQILVFAGFVAVFLLPGVIMNGLLYLKPTGRGMVSFAQHYADMIKSHQICPGPDPWFQYQAYMDAGFPGVQSLNDLIFLRPGTYLDFIGLSVSESIHRITHTPIVFLIAVAVYVYRKIQDKTMKMIVLLTLVNVLPIILLAYFHVRYQPRFYGLALFTVFAGLPNVQEKRMRWALVVFLVIVLAYQVYKCIPVFGEAYYAPD